MRAVVAALASVTAVLLWAPRADSRLALEVLLPAAGDLPAGRATQRVRDVWHDDPVELIRRWRLRRRPEDVELGALALLDATAPALHAGLPPAAAIRLAVESQPGEPTEAHGRFVEQLDATAASGLAISDAWVALADRSRSRPIGFVAAAWRLSEVTGAPLAAAVERAARGLREARTRERRVAVAVAGPRATVLVLTALPLTGPIFGLACGITPTELYLGSPLSTASVAAGFGLVLLGRWWCRRLVSSASSA